MLFFKRVLFVVLFLLCALPATASAASLYFNGAVSADWANDSNWWTNSGFTSPAGAIPTSTDDGYVYSSIDYNSFSPMPAEANSLTFYGSVFLSEAVTVATTATFQGTSYNSFYQGVVTGNAEFTDSSYNEGTVTGNAIFRDSSYNTGTITGNVDVYYPSPRPIGGTVGGTVTYHGSSKFFNGAVNAEWHNLGNWWDDLAFTQPASALPTELDDVNIVATVSTNAGDPVVVKTLTVASSSHFGIDATVLEGAVFTDSSVLDAATITGTSTFSGASRNAGHVAGDAIFSTTYFDGFAPTLGVITLTGTTTWDGTIDGVAYTVDMSPVTSYQFFDQSSLSIGGTATGIALFHDDSYLLGTVEGDAEFHGSSYATGEVTGNAMFDTLYYASSTANAGVFPFETGRQWEARVGGFITGTDDALITDFYFYPGSTNAVTVTVTSTFFSTTNVGTVEGAALFYGSAINGGNASGTQYFFDTSQNNSATLGTAFFNGQSLNNGTVDGDATFNTTYYASSTPSAGLFFVEGGVYWAGTVTGNIYGADGAPITDFLFYDGSTNISTITATSTFTSSTNGGVVNGTVYFYGDAINDGLVTGATYFFDDSGNEDDMTGAATFRGRSYNQGTVTGNAIFDTTYYASTTPQGGIFTLTGDRVYEGFIDGISYGSDLLPITDYVLNDESLLVFASVSGTVTLNDESGLGPSTINGDLIVNGDLPNTDFGDVTGTKTRRYTTSLTTTRDFASTGPWTVIANGAGVIVNVSGATFDGDTTFTEESGGLFIFDGTAPTPPGIPASGSPTTSAQPVISWDASTDAGVGLAEVPYLLQWSTSADFSGAVYATSTALPTFTPTSTLADGTWYFRVQASDLVGNQSSFVTSSAIVVNTATPAPAPVSSGGGGAVGGGGGGGAPMSVFTLFANPPVIQSPALPALFPQAPSTVTQETVEPQPETFATLSARFIAEGVSPASRAYGEGERRAIVRDVQETIGETATEEDFIRISSGLIPVTRNIKNERRQVSSALVAFKKVFGRAPNFRSERENTAWNTLMYRIRFPRDLVKEQKGIVSYRSLMRRTPVSPFDWAFVRLLGYVR
jgi:hypothetical protein